MLSIPSSAQVIVPNTVVLVSGWLAAPTADVLLQQITAETQQHQRAQMTYNRGWPARIDKGHTMARFGDQGVTYEYRGKPKPIHAMPKSIVAIRDLIDAQFDWHSNCCVVNTYEPSSGLYPHRDSGYIPQLGANPVIIAVSFGATRSFNLFRLNEKGKRNKQPITVQLGHGDLLIMHGTCDSDFHHSIPEEPHVVGTRTSLTFRKHLT